MFAASHKVICKFTRTWRKIQIQISGVISNNENISYNCTVQMSSLNQVPTNCCIWQSYDYYYIMIKLLPYEVKSMKQKFKRRK